jgi:hypothetical protein
MDRRLTIFEKMGVLGDIAPVGRDGQGMGDGGKHELTELMRMFIIYTKVIIIITNEKRTSFVQF